MYYRSRNFTCVIAYSLGGPSGNGYNMYKAYQWLKSVEKSRPVIYSDTLVGTNQLRLIVCGHEEQTTITALFDNLGKGACGAAIECLNLVLGAPPLTGLAL